MRRALSGLIALFLAGSSALHAEEPRPVRAVLELYTSQGCGDCPPADALLKSYAERKDVIALTLPVDYWDYLGWKDTLASPQNTARQRAYAARFDSGPLTTPEVVVNGLSHAPGANADEIERAIAASDTALASRALPVKISNAGGTVVIETGTLADPSDIRESTIWLGIVQKSASVPVKTGENAGKTLAYTNVVHELTPVGLWNGQPTILRLASGAVMKPDTEALVVLVQEGNSGPIIGAASFSP